jgi:hypothetical protein
MDRGSTIGCVRFPPVQALTSEYRREDALLAAIPRASARRLDLTIYHIRYTLELA